MMKTLTAIVLTIALAACSLTGCGSEKPNETQANSGAATPVVQAQNMSMTQSPYLDEEHATEEQHDAWNAEYSKRMEAAGKIDGRMNEFLVQVIKQFMKGSEDNVTLAPTNLYAALAMLGEVTSGDTRQEILDLLGVKDEAELTELASTLWDALYIDDGAASTLLGNSLWMNNNLLYNADIMQTLGEQYHASVFAGTMGSPEYDAMLQNWLDENTKGLLNESVKNVTMDAQTVLALASTIYFKAKWSSEFNPSATSQGTFHGTTGDQTVEFMHNSPSASYIEDEQFIALQMYFLTGGSMWVILPKDGVSAEDLLDNEHALKILSGQLSDEEIGICEANISMPKFDVTSELDLAEGIKNLGINLVFDSKQADFTNLVKDAEKGDVVLTDIMHASRVKIDEEGCEAAAFTVMLCGATCLPTPMEFNVDHPFLFSVNNDSGIPLFTGMINNL